MALLQPLVEKSNLGESRSGSIFYWDRETGEKKVEKVYGDFFVKLLYSSRVGGLVADGIFANRWVSKLAGAFQSSNLSRARISSFIRDFEIPMQEFETKSYTSFNDFFVRKFNLGTRPFVDDPSVLPAFAEARYLGFDKVGAHQKFPVKGKDLSAESVLGGLSFGPAFTGGPVLIARLCPVDYHRFHFPDDGMIRSDHRITGKFHSVNPVALRGKSDIFATNERHVNLLETEHFGKIAYVEVGALCVGKIVQSHPWSKPFKRGDEKGYFLFGASTVIIFGQPGKWVPDADILKNTADKMETFVKLGQSVGHA